jgi:hypothetical protein
MLGSRGRPLLGDSRAWAMLTLAGCVAVVVSLGLLFRGQTGPDGFRPCPGSGPGPDG